jgi:ATP-dependent DNA ligase
VLRRIFEDINATPIGLSENIEAPPTDMIRVAKEFECESIVAKRKDSLYESGKRTGAWAKYKVKEFVVRRLRSKQSVSCDDSRLLRRRTVSMQPR